MSKQLETMFKEKVTRRLATVKRSFFIKVQMVSLRGVPDLLGVVAGRFVALELKVGANKADKLQEWYIKKIIECGGYAKVVYPTNLDQVLAELQAIGDADGTT